MGLKAKIQSDLEKGLKDEDFFMIVAELFGYECSKTVGYIDTDERWDVLMKKDDKKARVQVKGLKHAHKFGYTWLELTKDDGTFGWLYGKADVFAIRLPDRINIYRMDLLRKVVDDKVNLNKPILKAIPIKENGENDYEYMKFRKYNGFKRRYDVTVIVSIEDIEHCKIFTMDYELELAENCGV
jgi:hypothetical protein